MASFVAYKKLKQAELRKMAKESITGIEKWFEKNPKRRVCRATLWYGITCKVPRKSVAETINLVLKNTLKKVRFLEAKT